MLCKTCNRDVNTPFCPYCGIKIDRDSPEALLEYISRQKDRLLESGKEAGRWVAWEKWLKETLT